MQPHLRYHSNLALTSKTPHVLLSLTRLEELSGFHTALSLMSAIQSGATRPLTAMLSGLWLLPPTPPGPSAPPRRLNNHGHPLLLPSPPPTSLNRLSPSCSNGQASTLHCL